MSQQLPHKPGSPDAITRRKRRNFQIAVGLGVLLLVSAFLIASHNAEAESVNLARKGEPLGDFVLQDIHGNEVRFSDFEGKTVLINAWATWCPPCRAEMPALEAYYRQHKDTDFVVLAINAAEPRDLAAAFVQSSGLTFPVVLDQDAHVLEALGVSGFPTSILVDGDGIVQHIHVGMFTEEALVHEITPFLN